MKFARLVGWAFACSVLATMVLAVSFVLAFFLVLLAVGL